MRFSLNPDDRQRLKDVRFPCRPPRLYCSINSDEFRRISDAAQSADISISSIYSFIRNGYINRYKDGIGASMVRVDELRGLLENITRLKASQPLLCVMDITHSLRP